MAYTQQSDGTIIINGFENGIADDPSKGLADMRNVNIISIPGEASVSFSTSATATDGSMNTPRAVSGTITTTSATNDTVTTTASLDTRQCIRFSVLSDATKGIALSTNYWVVLTGGTEWELYTAPTLAGGTKVNITADSITGTFATVNMTAPVDSVTDNNDTYWIIDSTGQVWTNTVKTTVTNQWVYTGNSGGSGSWSKPSLAFYQGSDGVGWLFAFRNDSIDYTKTSNTLISWTYGWNPATGGSGAAVLKNTGLTQGTHQAITAPDGRVYFCDGQYIGRFYQLDTTTPTAFNPATPSTYFFDENILLPLTESSTCLTYLGTSLMIGGIKNVIYTWDRVSKNVTSQILIAESYIFDMITINTNAFIMAGNRGRIYVTNGSQAQLYKKVPDHISGTVEPYYQWGGLASIKNQLYFSVLATTNAGTALTGYGGVWAIDVDTKAMRLTNKLSYATYSGYATVIQPIIPTLNVTNPGGAGLYIGWNSGASTYGVDSTISTPYTGGQSTIDSDLIPIGTFLKPTSSSMLEFKLARPLVSGESVKLQYRQIFNDNATGFADITSPAGTTTFNTVGIYSGAYQGVNFQNSQWIQIRAILTSTASSPSYVRLTEIRIK